MPVNLELIFPLKGVDKNWANSTQPPLTSPELLNVRPQDVSENRARGGQRPGLTKWGAGTQIGGIDAPVVAMTCIIVAMAT